MWRDGWGWSWLHLNTWMVDAIHRDGGRTSQWTSPLLTWPIKRLQFPALTALTPATVMSCYHDNLPYSGYTQEAILFSAYGYEKDAIVTVISGSSKVPIMAALWGFWMCSLVIVAFNRGRQCHSAYPLASTDWWFEGSEVALKSFCLSWADVL